MQRIVFILCCFAVNIACTSAEKIPDTLFSKNSQLLNAYHNGQAVLLYHVSAPDHTEAYFDWYSYFSDFIEQEGKNVYTMSLNPDQLAYLLNDDRIHANFSLFIKKGQPSYFYPDLILEPQIYQAVKHAITMQTLTDLDRAFIPETVTIDGLPE